MSRSCVVVKCCPLNIVKSRKSMVVSDVVVVNLMFG